MTTTTTSEGDLGGHAVSFDAGEVADILDGVYDDSDDAGQDGGGALQRGGEVAGDAGAGLAPPPGDDGAVGEGKSPTDPGEDGARTLAVAFHLARHTKNTARFDEDETDEVAIGALYLRHRAWQALGKPEMLVVTVEA